MRLGSAFCLGTAVLAAGVGLVGCSRSGDGAAGSRAAGALASDPIARGRYLVLILACNECHTPLTMTPQGPAPDMTRMLSGHPEALVMPPPPPLEGPWVMAGAATNTAFVGPWGVTYAANLTADENTGLGIWTEDMFVNAMRQGKHMGTSRTILPPMPWQAYGKMTDDDLKAVFAYLKTVPAIANHVPDWQPPGGEGD
jgi:hypothetical protein